MQEFEIEFDITPNQHEIDISDKVVELKPNLENLEVTPSSEEQIFKHEDSYGYDEVKVNAIHDDNLIADNIKKGVNILGVEGNLVGGKYKPRHIYADNGYPLGTRFFYGYKGDELEHEISMLDTTYFASMENTFGNCSNIISLDLSEWNISNVTTMYITFSSCTKLTELNVSNWDTSNVTTMYGMFNSCRGLTKLDLSNFDTSNVTNMSSMFWGCSKLKHLDIRNFTFDKVTSSNSMFSSVPSDCLIVVKGETEKEWILNVRSSLTNVKTVAEYEAS